MPSLATPPIVEALRSEDGVKVTFGDGLCTVFPSSLLYACKELAEIMSEKDCEDVHTPATQ